MKSLQNKRALITGGAQGIGLSIARSLAAAGAEIVLTDIDEDSLGEARSSLTKAGAECHTYNLDVTDNRSIAATRERLHQEVGRIDLLVNNAGVVHGGAFAEVPLERHLQTLNVNTEGVVAVTHFFLPDLIAAPESHLVNMSSASGLVGLPWGSTYAASKWAVFGFSESLRLELGRSGNGHVGVTVVGPSYVSTGMFDGVKPPRLTRFLTPERLAAKITQAVLAGRPYVLEPWLIKITPFLKGVLPRPVRDLLSDWFGATTGMRTWEGRGDEKGSRGLGA
jgi:short-subunit dehydrogenase